MRKLNKHSVAKGYKIEVWARNTLRTWLTEQMNGRSTKSALQLLEGSKMLSIKTREGPPAAAHPAPAIWHSSGRSGQRHALSATLTATPEAWVRRGDLSTHCYYFWSHSTVTNR